MITFKVCNSFRLLSKLIAIPNILTIFTDTTTWNYNEFNLFSITVIWLLWRNLIALLIYICWCCLWETWIFLPRHVNKNPFVIQLLNEWMILKIKQVCRNKFMVYLHHFIDNINVPVFSRETYYKAQKAFCLIHIHIVIYLTLVHYYVNKPWDVMKK